MTRPRAHREIDPVKVIERRLALGLTQRAVAQAALMSQSMLCDIEAGRRNGSPVTHKHLARALRLRRIRDLYRDRHDAA